MTYPSKKCASNKKMVAGLANNFFKKKQHIVKTKKKINKYYINKKQQTYLPYTALTYQIRSDK